jgi:SAM-dependent methyltransferase
LSDTTQVAGREEVERFLADTTFTGYQAVPLPHGLSLPGTDLSERIDQTLKLPLDGRSFLDVGSYYGIFPYAATQRGAVRAVGLEPDDERSAVARRIAELHGSRWEIRQSRVEDLADDESFDVVTFLNVLHHVLDPIEAIRRLVRVCNETLIVEFCLPDDPQHLVHLYDPSEKPSRLNRYRARLRSFSLRVATGRLPLMAVGDWPVHRTFYFTPAAFENLFRVHHGFFDSIEFEPSNDGLRRVMAWCQVNAAARERIRSPAARMPSS